MILPEGYTFEKIDGGFSLRFRPDFPRSQARCLAVAAASWVRAAAGGGAKILWPNRVVLDGARVCAMECRAAAAGELIFTFRPEALPIPAEAFAEAVVLAAVEDLAGFPDNQPALLEKYCEHCLTVMKFVNVTYRGMPIYGFAFAVDKHGGLMVMTQESHTVVTVYGGEAEIVKKGEEPDRTQELPHMPGN